MCDCILLLPDILLHRQESRPPLAAAAEVYLHLSCGVLWGSRPVRRLTTWVWNPPRALTMQGVTTQVSNPKSSTAWTTALKNNPDTHGAAPSLLRMHDILLQTLLARAKFFTTAGQPSSDANIKRPRYLNEVTTSRGRPQTLKSLAVNSLSSSSANRHLFRSTPWAHCAVRQCVLFRDFHGTRMSQVI